MNEGAMLPRPVQPFVAFSTLLRGNAFPVAPDQTQDFIAAIELLGPRSMNDIHAAALATLAPPPERRDEFDALFNAFFLGQTIAAPVSAEMDEDEMRAFDEGTGEGEAPEPDEITESGAEATAAERFMTRRPAALDETAALRRLRRRAPVDLPRRRSRRRVASTHGEQPDMRRALREAVKFDGELLRLPVRARRLRQRRIVLLIDISGSMKAQTDRYLQFAHVLARSVDRCEVFTLGTRLTRVTRALRLRGRGRAMSAVAGLVADWDGGTRLGAALSAFLGVPRFAGFARGALVVILSDGLERGDPSSLVEGVRRLARLAWSVLWLTPLARDGQFRPQTEAMAAIAPFVDRIGSGSDIPGLTSEVLEFSKRAA